MIKVLHLNVFKNVIKRIKNRENIMVYFADLQIIPLKNVRVADI